LSLTREDVQRLLELLDASQFDELHLETGDLKLTLRRSGARAPDEPRGAPSTEADAAPGAAPSPRAAADYAEIRAPLLGTFYRAPKPGAEPFVAVGARVERDTVVGIIEVMKLMNSVAAGVRGEIVEILAEDAKLVEYGEVLMRVRPD
jgi:acetyl-CoA carboxylase biotin carboxyl carrier protein